MKRALYKLLLFINKAIIVCMLLAHSASHISPEKIWGLAFFGIAYPVFLLANVLFLLLWLTRRRAVAILPFLFIVLNHHHVLNYFPVNLPFEQVAEAGTQIKLLSYNVRIFDHYNWTGDKQSGTKAISYVVGEKADIVFFQEFYAKNNDGRAPKERLEQEADLKFSVSVAKPGNKRYIDLAIFSKYPIINHYFMNRDKRQYALVADIAFKMDTFRCINVHLQSLRFKKEEYNFIDSLGKQSKSATKSSFLKVGGKLKNAFRKRASQADELAKVVKESPYPVLLAGDFNDTPSSYTYHQIRGQLHDVFVEKGFGLGATYTRVHFPFRIDYLMCDSTFSIVGYKKHSINYSDHKPISCELTYTAPDNE